MSSQSHPPALRRRSLPLPASLALSEPDLVLASVQAVLHVAGLVLVFALALLLAEYCVEPAWVLPSALALTCGFLLIGIGLLLAGRQVRRLLRGAAALAWRCLSWDNLNYAVFVAGVLLGLWNLGAAVPGRWW